MAFFPAAMAHHFPWGWQLSALACLMSWLPASTAQWLLLAITDQMSSFSTVKADPVLLLVHILLFSAEEVEREWPPKDEDRGEGLRQEQFHHDR